MNTLLGQRIREQRKEKGWTIEQFAERVELSANYVGDLERGVKIPKGVRQIPRISLYLSINSLSPAQSRRIIGEKKR